MLCAATVAERSGQKIASWPRRSEIGVDVLIAADVELRQPDYDWPAS